MQNVEQCARHGALNPPRTVTWNAKAEHQPRYHCERRGYQSSRKAKTVKGYRIKSPLFLPQAKEHTMKIIVTGSPTTGPLHGQYEAKKWEVDQYGELIIFGDNDKVVGTHAPGTWAHVRGYAEEH